VKLFSGVWGFTIVHVVHLKCKWSQASASMTALQYETWTDQSPDLQCKECPLFFTHISKI